MVPVGADRGPELFICTVLERIRIIEILPPGRTFQDHHSIFITCIIKRLNMRIVRHSHKIKPVLFELFHFSINRTLSHGVPDHVRLRMQVCSVDLCQDIIHIKAVPLPFHLADAVCGVHAVFLYPVHIDGCTHRIQFRRVCGPEPRVIDRKHMGEI